ncbi:MAG: hypothetical protein ABFD91_06715 [Anaerohalosphaeraceae bacterium]
MKKAGLQKKIAFIFDGEEVQGRKNVPLGNPSLSHEASAAAPRTTSAGPELQHSTGYGLRPTAPSMRPQPVPRKNPMGANTLTLRKAAGLIKHRAFGSKVDKRQKKMTVLVALLTLVFFGVIYFALGTEPSQASAATQNTDSGQKPNPTAAGKLTVSWGIPKAYSPVRDPMLFPSKQNPEGSLALGGLVVKGIVYTPQKPTAIISGQVVAEGETISGIVVRKIEKDIVEFEKDGKRWKQQVEH